MYPSVLLYWTCSPALGRRGQARVSLACRSIHWSLPVPYAITARSSRNPRLTRVRPLFYLPLVLFCTSILGGLAVLAAQLPVEAF